MQRETDAGQAATPQINHVVAVASGKGGVGKSTVAVNLALALCDVGLRVGVLDADILGPSVPTMLGLPLAQPVTEDGLLVPGERFGLRVASMGMLTDDDKPAILRGPMVSKYIQLFYSGVAWGPLDVLVIDLPPGTGDTQLTLAQKLPLSGAVIVTTPQDVSTKIARRGLRMFQTVNVPILGIVENMSGFACPHCGEETALFGEGGGARLAAETGARFLGPVPLDPYVVQAGDQGTPVVRERPQSAVARAYARLADALVTVLAQSARPVLPPFVWTWQSGEGAPAWRRDAVVGAKGHPQVITGLKRQGARSLGLLWQDGVEHSLDVRELRLACECAQCIEEMTRRRLLDPHSVPLDVEPLRLATVGRYAVAVEWSDGHQSGIYSFEKLRRMGDAAAAQPEVVL